LDAKKETFFEAFDVGERGCVSSVLDAGGERVLASDRDGCSVEPVFFFLNIFRKIPCFGTEPA
jgi:hypothetical protein